MTERRAAPPFEHLYREGWTGPNGRGCCRWCGVEVPKGRSSWCSQECVDEYKATDPSLLRDEALERDAGVCALCGLDTMTIDTWKAPVRPEWPEPEAPTGWENQRFSLLRDWLAEKLELERDYWTERGFYFRRSPWEADHIVPLSEDGPHSLENLQTLCVPCHKGKTKIGAGRRAEARRE